MSAGDDAVEYRIFLDPPVHPLPPAAELQRCVAARTAIMGRLAPRLQRCLWQREPFGLWVWDPSQERDVQPAMPPHLWGRVGFGESIDDEWFVVSLLLQISVEQRDLIVCVRDADGEFLLIEAAYAIPKWLTPDTAANRIFLRQGQLLILQPPLKGGRVAPGCTPPALPNAVAQIAAGSGGVAHAAVTAAIHRRIEQLPLDGVRRPQPHRVRCTLPLAVAQLLHAEPQLVAGACASFHARGAKQMRAAAALPRFSPRRSPLVDARVALSRCMFAQLSAHRFLPPADAGFDLHGALPRDRLAAELGCKLAFGLELLCQDAADVTAAAGDAASEPSSAEGASSSSAAAATTATAEGVASAATAGEAATAEAEEAEEATMTALDAAEDDGWLRFCRELEARGYFRGEMAGSALHRRLRAEAARAYRSPHSTRDPLPWRRREAARVLRLLSEPSSLAPADAFPPAWQLPPDDDTGWMQLSEAGLEAALRTRVEASDARAAASEAGTGATAAPTRRAKATATAATAAAAATAASLREGPVAEDRSQSSAGAGRTGVGAVANGSEATQLQQTSERLKEVAESVGDFIGGAGAVEGAEIPRQREQQVLLDPERFLRALEAAVGAPADASRRLGGGANGRGEGDASGSSDEDGDGDEDDDDTDVDDDEDDYDDADGVPGEERVARLEELMAAMDAELHRSSKTDDFEREATEAGVPSASADGADEAVRPVNLDLNLVKNLLSSYSSQQGLAGPASNLLGSMGIQLPDDEDA